LDIMIKDRNSNTNINEIKPIKKNKDKYSTKKIDTFIKKDIMLDFLEDEYVDEYYKMKKNNKKK